MTLLEAIVYSLVAVLSGLGLAVLVDLLFDAMDGRQ